MCEINSCDKAVIRDQKGERGKDMWLEWRGQSTREEIHGEENHGTAADFERKTHLAACQWDVSGL